MDLSRFLSVTLLASLTFFLAAPAQSATIEKTFPFELDEWYDINVEDGGTTIHRIRVASVDSNFKSIAFRGSNTQFSQTVQIQIEYTNTTSRDREADLDVVWVDSRGNEIDGYRDEEDMDEEESDEMTAMISTLKYGIEQAKKLKVKIRF